MFYNQEDSFGYWAAKFHFNSYGKVEYAVAQAAIGRILGRYDYMRN